MQFLLKLFLVSITEVFILSALYYKVTLFLPVT